MLAPLNVAIDSEEHWAQNDRLWKEGGVGGRRPA